MSQFRSSNFAEPHVMPSPPATPWNWDAKAMPWAMPSPYPRVMEFNASESERYVNAFLLNNGHKRKSDEPLPSPSKQFITEEKMAAHLNGLHISPNYISHDTNKTIDIGQEQKQNLSSTDFTMDSDIEYNTAIPLTAKELEEKLKNANKITICEEVRKLNEHDSIVPKALLSRIEKPCTALVLWQPPQKIQYFITNKASYPTIVSSTSNKKQFDNADSVFEDFEDDSRQDQQNNNSSILDYNYSMETDMM